MLPDVAQRQRAQQRVADGVQQHVAVRMRDHAAVERDFYAAEDQPPALGQPVHVVACADAQPGHSRRSFRSLSARKQTAFASLTS